MKEEFDFESIKNKAIEQLKAGKPLLGKDGAFAPLLESILNAALEGEMDAHLTEEERQMGNRRNGKMQKQVQTPLGEVTVSTPRDRNSSFDPQFIKKRETIPVSYTHLDVYKRQTFMDATDGLAAAYCHFLQMGRPTVEKGYHGWKDFIAKNPDKVKK